MLGHSRRVDLSGFSKATAGVHEGILKQCDLVARAPSHIRNKALKLVAAKVVLALGDIDFTFLFGPPLALCRLP